MADKYTNRNLDNSSFENLNSFSGFFDKRYLDPFINGYAFVFVTKPRLFIEPIPPGSSGTGTPQKQLAYKNMISDPVFVPFTSLESINRNDKLIPRMLSFFPTSEYSSGFLKMFTNSINSFDPMDVTMEQTEIFETKQGYRMPLAASKTISEAIGSISLSINETSNLDFTKLLSLWINYISNITDGTFSANPEMIKNGVVDYASSIFYFVLEPDGKTLKYWSKYTGCWPTTIPFGAFKYTKGQRDISSFDVNFVYAVKEDMNPQILEEFNRIALGITEEIIPVSDLDYASCKESVLLNKDKLISYRSSFESIINSLYRDPLVFFKNSVDSSSESTYSDSIPGKFELSFPSGTYEDSFQKNVLDTKYRYYVDNF